MQNVVELRPATADDQEFLYRVYASTRDEELAPLGWSDAQKELFLRSQFSAQDKFYHQQFPGADFRIILLEDEPIGRLYVERREEEIRLIDIALLPAHRNTGIGTALLEDILAQGAQLGLPVCIHVERFNPARRLYERLGFREIGENGVYYFMEWRPTSQGVSGA